jgi:dihydrofolate reductase
MGVKGKLPWGFNQKSDLKRFKKLTENQLIVMGRKTYESLPGLLPNRTNLVVSESISEESLPTGVLVTSSIESARQISREIKNPAFIIGGASLALQMIKYVDEIFLTIIDCQFEGDAIFDLKVLDAFTCINSEYFESDENNKYPYRFEHWRRTDL